MNEAKKVVEPLSDPLVLLSEDLVVRDVNRTFYRVFDTRPEDTIGGSLREVATGCFGPAELRPSLENRVGRERAFE